jgi:hypothetical protein
VDRLVRIERSEDSFEKIGREWYAKQSEAWVPEHAARILSRLERDIFPFVGGRPITAIENPRIVGSPSPYRSARVRETVRRARQIANRYSPSPLLPESAGGIRLLV